MDLHFGTPQTVILIVFGAITLVLTGIFAVVALNTRREQPFERIQEVGYRLRRPWLTLLVTLLVAVIGLALFQLPYASDAAPATVVRITGGQFYWSATPASVAAGQTVRFDVSAADVNHGLGIYDPDGRLIGSVQAMPGFANHLDVDLDQPGEYMLSCLEFCGVGHHKMMRTFEVVEARR